MIRQSINNRISGSRFDERLQRLCLAMLKRSDSGILIMRFTRTIHMRWYTIDIRPNPISNPEHLMGASSDQTKGTKRVPNS
nr:hypothetical protein [Tanacetum cinerariifolium]